MSSSVKFNKQMREALINSVVEYNYPDEEEYYNEAIKGLQKQVQRLFDKKYGDLYSKYPELFISENINIFYRYIRNERNVTVTVNIFCPYGERGLSSDKRENWVEHKIMTKEQLQDIVVNANNIGEAMIRFRVNAKKLENKMRAFLLQFNTVDKLLEIVPEFKVFVEKSKIMMPKCMLPAVRKEEVLHFLKIEKEKKNGN
jgi:hypothetical protein